MRESLKDAIQDAAQLYFDKLMAQGDVLPLGYPQQFNVQRYIDEYAGKTYWETEFFRGIGSFGSCRSFYDTLEAKNIYCDSLNNLCMTSWLESIKKGWQEAWDEKIQVAIRTTPGR